MYGQTSELVPYLGFCANKLEEYGTRDRQGRSPSSPSAPSGYSTCRHRTVRSPREELFILGSLLGHYNWCLEVLGVHRLETTLTTERWTLGCWGRSGEPEDGQSGTHLERQVGGGAQ